MTLTYWLAHQFEGTLQKCQPVTDCSDSSSGFLKNQKINHHKDSFLLFVKAFNIHFSVLCMPGDYDTSWMYVFSVLTLRLLNYSNDTDCVCHVLHPAETTNSHSEGRGKMSKPKNESRVFNKLIHHVWVRTKQFQHSWFIFYDVLEAEFICLSALLVFAHELKTKYITRTYHLFMYFYVEGPDFVYIVNMISLFPF